MAHVVFPVMVIGHMARGHVHVHLRNIIMLVVALITVRGLERVIIRQQMTTVVTSVLINQATHIILVRHRVIHVRGNAMRDIMVRLRRAIHHAKHAAAVISARAEHIVQHALRLLIMVDIHQILSNHSH